MYSKSTYKEPLLDGGSFFVIFFLFFALPIWGTFFLRIDPMKDQWNVLYVASFFALLSFFKNPLYLKVDSFQKKVFLILGGFLFLNYFLHDLPFVSYFTLDRFCYAILAGFFLQVFSHIKSFNFLFLPVFSTTVLITVTAYIFRVFKVDLLDLSSLISDTMLGPSMGKFSSVFGNPNMTSQFMGFSILLQLYGFAKMKERVPRVLLSLLSVLSVAYILDLQCKSMMISIALCVGYLFLKPLWLSRAHLSAILIGGFLCGRIFLPLLGNMGAIGETIQNPFLLEAFQKPLSFRWDLLKAALLMLWKNLFGVGVGGFEFGSIPYEISFKTKMLGEGAIAKSPHCEYLRFLIEDGLHVVVVAVILLGSLLWKVRRKLLLVTTDSLFFLLLAFVILIEMLFQFPMELPFTFSLGAMLFGYFFSDYYNTKSFAIPVALKTLLVGVLVLLISFQTWTMIVERVYVNDRAKSAWVCKYNPLSYEACLNVAAYDLKKQDWASAEHVISKELKKRPYNFSALRLWVESQIFQNKIPQACEGAILYDQMFAEPQTCFSKFIYGVCHTGPYEKQPESFQKTYESFLKYL
ncbi:MAG: hypothetical protein WCG05_03545 [Alphaproteobacteria bacterium]